MKNILRRTKTTVKKLQPVKARGYAHKLKSQLVPKVFQKTEIHLNLSKSKMQISVIFSSLLLQEFTFGFTEIFHYVNYI